MGFNFQIASSDWPKRCLLKPGDRPGGDEYGSETRWFEFGSHSHTYA